jgi:hypothetical protein
MDLRSLAGLDLIRPLTDIATMGDPARLIPYNRTEVTAIEQALAGLDDLKRQKTREIVRNAILTCANEDCNSVDGRFWYRVAGQLDPEARDACARDPQRDDNGDDNGDDIGDDNVPYPEGYDPADAPPGTHPCGAWYVVRMAGDLGWVDYHCLRLPVTEDERQSVRESPAGASYQLGYGCIGTRNHPYSGTSHDCQDDIWPVPDPPP